MMKLKVETTDYRRKGNDVLDASKNWEFRCCLDPEKMHAYDAFLKRVSKDKVIVDLGSGNGVMAYLALQHGAKKVICIDYNPVSIPVIQTNLREYIDEGKVSVHELDAINADLSLIKDADYIVHEIFGHNVHDELIADIAVNMVKHDLLDKVYPKLIEWFRVDDTPIAACMNAPVYFKENYPETVADFHELHSKRIEDLQIVQDTMTVLDGDHEQAEWVSLGITRLDNLDLMTFVPAALEPVKYLSYGDRTESFFTWKCYFDDTKKESYRGGGRQLGNWGYMPGPSGSKGRFIEAIRFGENINPHVSF